MFLLALALADPERLDALFRSAGFRDVIVKQETRQIMINSFDDYWADVDAGVDAGIGMLPQAYAALPDGSRRSGAAKR